MGLAAEVAEATRIEELQAALIREQRRSARLATRTEDLVEAVYRAARDAAAVVGTPPPISRPEKRDRRRSPEVALLHTTDWQMGKATESFSTQICEERVRLMVRKTIQITELQRSAHPVRQVMLLLGGDLIENVSIFPGQPFEVDSTAFAQVFAASALVEQIVVSLLGAFEQVSVWEVHGNHGRIGRKGDSPRADNLDAIVGRIARERLMAQDRLQWHVPESWYAIAEVGAYRAMLVHGDQIRSFGGNVPAYGVLRKASAWAAGAIPEKFQDLYLGHMHQPMSLQMPHGGLVYMTPSVESGSAYAREFMGAHGRAGQRLHYIDPAKGRVTASYLLDLE